MQNNPNYRSGFIAIVGRPNVGKSTFMNRIIGQKIAIMSNKAQTTRNKIQGVYSTKDAQLIFIDTPGIQKPKNKLGTFMEESSLSALREVDAILFMVSAVEKRGAGDNFIINKLKSIKKPVYLIVNKIDQINPNDLVPIVDSYKRNTIDWKGVFPISALQGNNVEQMLNQLARTMPHGPQYYPTDQITDHPERFIVSELIREKIFQLTKEEVPYSVAVFIERMKKRDSGMVDIDATIIIDRNSQKGIIIGSKGSMLKKIGTLARKDIQDLLGSKVFLKLWVKVQPNWRDNSNELKSLGYHKSNY
ncbi:GTPase Era [Philodulcilactobacillus myokoensis]|uniref:GTPase Era n=1 Tax=Philodulcilactobacillus myokoensis TaxID=2929573 RepID=A0A9W6B0U4_9LACO|nr:GTPase Era [Philodulcilactobacillus myokoensis]GLB46909.1 GTPase Era [Philodulcilactobacillus myokoensis]